MYRIRRMHLISHIIKQQQVSSICCIIKYLPRLHMESVADTHLKDGICHTFYGFAWKVSARCLTQTMLPLQNLVEVVSLRVLDAESANCFVVSLSHVVSDVLVVILCCTAVDVNYAWRNLAGSRILEICEV